VSPGVIIDVPEPTARELVGCGLATDLPEKVKAKK
jgi:hypothetical protein